jgi:hypothetical protein
MIGLRENKSNNHASEHHWHHQSFFVVGPPLNPQTSRVALAKIFLSQRNYKAKEVNQQDA